MQCMANLWPLRIPCYSRVFCVWNIIHSPLRGSIYDMHLYKDIMPESSWLWNILAHNTDGKLFFIWAVIESCQRWWMMSEVNGQWCSSPHCSSVSRTAALRPAKGVWLCWVTEGMRCEHRLYLEHYCKLFREEPAQQQHRHTPPQCVLSGCSSYHCGCGGLAHNYSVMSN